MELTTNECMCHAVLYLRIDDYDDGNENDDVDDNEYSNLPPVTKATMF
jgi:hypothetical protein